MKIRLGSEASTEDFWYDLSEGYIKPEDILEDQKDIERVKGAMLIIDEFYRSCLQQIPGFLR